MTSKGELPLKPNIQNTSNTGKAAQLYKWAVLFNKYLISISGLISFMAFTPWKKQRVPS